MNKIKFYINIIDVIVCFIRIYLYFCIINEDDMNEVKKRLPLQCPSCDAPLKVGRLFCEECNTEVCGNFELPLLARLSEKEQQFVLDFVKSSGSLKDMAKNIGVSYPTVRNMLDDIIDKLTKMAEHLIVWLIPALLFYLGGLFLSHSRIRVIDVLGTVLFAQLPLLGMNLISLLPAMRMMSQMNMNMSPEEMLAQPYFILAMILTLLGLPFLILTLIWMFNALKVSCNLKQWKLWTVALIGIIGGDVLCRFLIGWLY